MTSLLPTQTRGGLSGTALKRIACATMLIDHIGASCIEAGILRPAMDAGMLSADALASTPLYWLDTALRLTGRLAFPIFCFLLVEGFMHTHNVKKYVQRLLLFGLVSEVPFDLAFFRTPFHPDNQNVYWTLALGVLAMAGLKHFETESGTASWKGILCTAGCALAAELARTDYGAVGILLIAALYATRASRKKQCIIGAVMMLFELTAPLAFVLIWFYNGKRGACGRVQQKVFYWFYPVHIALLACITNLIL